MLQPFIPTITTSSTPNSQQKLYTLLSGINTGVRTVCALLKVQADPYGGGTKFAVGNSNVAPSTGVAGTGVGVQLAAGQTYEVGPFESNLIHLDQIYVSASAASSIFNVTVVTR